MCHSNPMSEGAVSFTPCHEEEQRWRQHQENQGKSISWKNRHQDSVRNKGNTTCEVGMRNRQILKFGCAELSYVEQKREWVPPVGVEKGRSIHLLRTDWKIKMEALRRSKSSKQLAERTNLTLDGCNKWLHFFPNGRIKRGSRTKHRSFSRKELVECEGELQSIVVTSLDWKKYQSPILLTVPLLQQDIP